MPSQKEFILSLPGFYELLQSHINVTIIFLKYLGVEGCVFCEKPEALNTGEISHARRASHLITSVLYDYKESQTNVNLTKVSLVYLGGFY